MRWGALALCALAVGCTPRPPKPCGSCRLYESRAPYLTTCFAESRPYDTDFGCSTRPEGPTTAIRLANGLESARVVHVLAFVDGKTIFDSNLQLVLSRDTFPIATLPAMPNQLFQIKIDLVGTGKMAGYLSLIHISEPTRPY